MDIKNDYTYAVVVPTSMGVRITPINRQPVYTSNTYTMQASSAESNVANVSAALGLRVKLLTTFVKDSEIALFIKGELNKRSLEFEGKEIPSGGPWGYRHQFNIADAGFGMRGPRVMGDRAGEVGRTLNAKDFDLDSIFNKEGVAVLHMSGLVAALSPETGAFCVELAKAAKAVGTLVSFDFNYRASFWEGREQELRAVFSEIAANADILIGNEEDYQLALGIEGPKADDKGLAGKTDAFRSMIGSVKRTYTNASVFAATLRESLNAKEHMWGAMMLYGDDMHVIEPRQIPVYDRIGGGDGFVGGLLYAIIKGWEPEKCLQFGWAAGALAAAVETDYAQPMSEEQLWSIFEGNARVKR